MATKAVEKTIDIWKKKRWHKILAPKLFNEMVIGETPALEPNLLVGRTLKSNMMTLTGDIKKQNIDVTFEVERVMGDTAYTEIKSFEIGPSSIRRFVRRDKTRIDDSFICMTADNKKVRIKPFMVTLSKVPNSITTNIRRRTREYFARTVKGMTYDVLCREVVNYNLQKSLKGILNKIYPVRVCDLRVLEIVKGEIKGKPLEVAAAKPAETVVEAAAEIPAEEAKAETMEQEETEEEPAKNAKVKTAAEE